ncbi:MAG: glycine--tRNA ligase [Blastocatellia bacterium]|nr:glycine--tRNA ligase [Blastocatellia bacterium]MCS7156563.1 glycine--tRNA ligase [Blastocatellia bacterium]MCX7751696.1 glycine--tRNA ligase [Blastocatellia bacterium]MDW8168797.1 glycine--tRNA ligase [Acidobacteriota bacterium]MDW8257591.1 glycine--tRNA ligase [Acidobacteriota bacterium]
MSVSLETIRSLCKRRGFVFPSSEIYGGIESIWDYGPLGVELKNNIKRAWWRAVVYERDDIEGLDAAILMNRLVWKYSGHEETFSDPLVDCRECKRRFRADDVLEESLKWAAEQVMADVPWEDLSRFVEESAAFLDELERQERERGRVYPSRWAFVTEVTQNPEIREQLQRRIPESLRRPLPEIDSGPVKAWAEVLERVGPLFRERLEAIRALEASFGRTYESEAQLLRQAIVTYRPWTTDVVRAAWNELFVLLNEKKALRCPRCGAVASFTPPRRFNLMFKTFMGPVEEESALVYLRPETAQGIFVNFLNVLGSARRKLPFGIAQIGKAFRNEITPGQFLFRVREFEQMEIEYFVRPGEDEAWFEHWVEERFRWYLRLGFRAENLRRREQSPEELAHYSKRTVDIEYRFPMGWGEIEGIANRTDYDLRAHSKSDPRNEHATDDLTYFDQATSEHITPYVIEPSAGVDRIFLALLCDAYHEETVRGEKRVVLRLHRDLAPIKVAVFPLLRNRSELVELARRIAADLRRVVPGRVVYDDTASIGRLYRRQDEIGTPYCVTVDVQSLSDEQVTIRDRDTMEQVRLPIARLGEYFAEQFRSSLVG